MVGHGVLLDAALRGGRAVLLEPLRALAQEQSDQLSDLLQSLPKNLFSQPPSLMLSTGDYRIDGEPMAAAPPSGELVVATPERFDAILRNPANAEWVREIGAVVVDEAHLLGDARRGPTLEAIVATMLSRANPPRIALLSATLGAPERLQEWLNPCDLIESRARSPLCKEVWALEPSEDANQILVNETTSVLSDPTSALLVFVYRRTDSETLARQISDATQHTALAYHSGQSSAERTRVRAAFLSGRCRCMVSTTALALGVNLPATHVVVRDSTFFGEGRLPVDQLLQILGRAGRGDRSGTGAVIVRPNDGWKPDELAAALESETLPKLTSSFERWVSRAKGGRGKSTGDGTETALAEVIATALSRAGLDGLTVAEVSAFLAHTLSGARLGNRSEEGLRWLADPSRRLAYRGEDGRYRLTTLGVSGSRRMLPLDYVAGFGQLMRDLIALDPGAGLLRRWSGLDHLLVMALLSGRGPSLRRFSEGLVDQVDAYLEATTGSEKSFLFSTWVSGSPKASKADELFGSLGIGGKPDAEVARKTAYVAMLNAIVLDERSKGTSVDDIQRRWTVSIAEGAEESWRDAALWLLAGHAGMLDLRCFYHHLIESEATRDQIYATKAALRRCRVQAFELVNRIRYCSPLGPLVGRIRASRGGARTPQVGAGTIATLEAAGVKTLGQVALLDVDQLAAIGVQRRFAKQIRAYVTRRLR